MIYVKMLNDKTVNGIQRKRGEVVKTDQWTAISLVDGGEADFTNDVPREVEAKAKRGRPKAEPETATIEPEENEMMPNPKPKRFGRRGKN